MMNLLIIQQTPTNTHWLAQVKQSKISVQQPTTHTCSAIHAGSATHTDKTGADDVPMFSGITDDYTTGGQAVPAAVVINGGSVFGGGGGRSGGGNGRKGVGGACSYVLLALHPPVLCCSESEYNDPGWTKARMNSMEDAEVSCSAFAHTGGGEDAGEWDPQAVLDAVWRCLPAALALSLALPPASVQQLLQV